MQWERLAAAQDKAVQTRRPETAQAPAEVEPYLNQTSISRQGVVAAELPAGSKPQSETSSSAGPNDSVKQSIMTSLIAASSPHRAHACTHALAPTDELGQRPAEGNHHVARKGDDASPLKVAQCSALQHETSTGSQGHIMLDDPLLAANSPAWRPYACTVADHIVAVTSGSGWASGVVVHSSGLVLTVAHAVSQTSTSPDFSSSGASLYHSFLDMKQEERDIAGGPDMDCPTNQKRSRSAIHDCHI